MTLTQQSPCKINLLLNILGRRPDGFHELETVMQPVEISDELTIERSDSGILGCQSTCGNSRSRTRPTTPLF